MRSPGAAARRRWARGRSAGHARAARGAGAHHRGPRALGQRPPATRSCHAGMIRCTPRWFKPFRVVPNPPAASPIQDAPMCLCSVASRQRPVTEELATGPAEGLGQKARKQRAHCAAPASSFCTRLPAPSFRASAFAPPRLCPRPIVSARPPSILFATHASLVSTSSSNDIVVNVTGSRQ